MRATILPQSYHTDQDPHSHDQYDSLGEYCGLSTACEMFLNFTTQLFSR